MRDIKYIVLHTSETSQTTTVKSILDFWKNENKWKKPGYHFIIEADGKIDNLLPIEKQSNGVAGFNTNSIHICYIGGLDSKGKKVDNRTPKQVLSQLQLLIELKEKFPKAIIQGHRDFKGVTKTCPSFDVKAWLPHVGFK